VIKIADIFIIDDEHDIIFLFERFLKSRGHDIIDKAYDGEQALKIFKNFQLYPDIIFLDHRVPYKIVL